MLRLLGGRRLGLLLVAAAFLLAVGAWNLWVQKGNETRIDSVQCPALEAVNAALGTNMQSASGDKTIARQEVASLRCTYGRVSQQDYGVEIDIDRHGSTGDVKQQKSWHASAVDVDFAEGAYQATTGIRSTLGAVKNGVFVSVEFDTTKTTLAKVEALDSQLFAQYVEP